MNQSSSDQDSFESDGKTPKIKSRTPPHNQPYRFTITGYEKKGKGQFEIRKEPHEFEWRKVDKQGHVVERQTIRMTSTTCRDDIGSAKEDFSHRKLSEQDTIKKYIEEKNKAKNLSPQDDDGFLYASVGDYVSSNEFSISREDKEKSKKILLTAFKVIGEGKRIIPGTNPNFPYLDYINPIKPATIVEDIPEFGRVAGNKPKASIGVNQILDRIKRKRKQDSIQLEDNKRDNEIEEQRHHQLAEESAKKIAGMVTNSSAHIIELALQVALLKKSSIEERRRQMSQLYFIPKRITGKAISLVLSSISKEGTPIIGSYNLPTRFEVSELALRLGYDSIEEFVEDISIGLNQQETAKLFGRKPGPKEKARKSNVIRELITDSDSEIDEDDLAQLEEEGIAYEESGSVDEQEDEVDDVVPIVFKNKNSQQCYYPFRFTVEYSYCVLYYHYYHLRGYLLPFGRTQPDRAWVYIFSLLLDPKDTLQLRLSDEQVAYKIGGLSLLERRYNTDNSALAAIHRRLIKPIMTSGNDISKFKNILVECFKNIAKMQHTACRLSDMLNKIAITSECMTKTRRALTSLCESQRVQENPTIKSIIFEANKAYTSAIKPDYSQDSVLTIFGQQHQQDRITLKKLLSPLRPEAVHFCNTVTAMYEKVDTDRNAVEWFDSIILKSIATSHNPLSYFLSMATNHNTRKILEKNFIDKDQFESILKYINNRRGYIRNLSGDELQKLHSNRYLRTTVDFEWSSALSKPVLISEQTKRSNFEEIENEMFLGKRTNLAIQSTPQMVSGQQTTQTNPTTHQPVSVYTIRRKAQNAYARVNLDLTEFNSISEDTMKELLTSSVVDKAAKLQSHYFGKSSGDLTDKVDDFLKTIISAVCEYMKFSTVHKLERSTALDYLRGMTSIQGTWDTLHRLALLLIGSNEDQDQKVGNNIEQLMNCVRKVTKDKRVQGLNVGI